jgi:hypothetical protein
MSRRGFRTIYLRRGARLDKQDTFGEVSPKTNPAVGDDGAGSDVQVQKRTPVASIRDIRNFLVALYKEQKSPPNVNEAFDLVREHFKAQGKSVRRQPVRDILDEPEFAAQRLTAGSRKKP